MASDNKDEGRRMKARAAGLTGSDRYPRQGSTR
jgi:hypothetical protein